VLVVTETDSFTVRPTLSEATAMSVAIIVVTVDESGLLKDLRRMDGAPLVSVDGAEYGVRDRGDRDAAG
jgi:uncharacterized protein GlcG (DUF336 family)